MNRVNLMNSLSLIFKRKSFYLAAAGIFFTFLLVLRASHKTPESTSLIPPPQKPFSQSVSASGIVEAVGENIRLASAVSGLVARINVKQGQKIQEGEVLAELDDRTLKGQWGVAKASVEKISSRYKKIQSLSHPEALSTEERDSVRYDLEIARAELKRLELQLDQLKIRSPQDAEVLQVNTRVGEFIATPMGGSGNYEPPFLLAAGQGIQIRADVDEVNAKLVKAGSAAKGFVKGIGNQEGFDLTFVRIDPYVIPKKSLTGDNVERVDTRVLQVIFKADQRHNLYMGQQVDVYIQYE